MGWVHQTLVLENEMRIIRAINHGEGKMSEGSLGLLFLITFSSPLSFSLSPFQFLSSFD